MLLTGGKILKKIIIYLVILIFLSSALLFKLVQAGVSNVGSLVIMRGSQFSPQTIHVTPGTTITWVNQDSISHTTTSDNMTLAESWDSGTLAPGQSFSKTFTQPGNYTYHCSIHPSMKGTVQVVSAGQTVSAAQNVGIGVTSPATAQLPATGTPLAMYSLVGLIPVGLKLIRHEKILPKEKESAQTIWEKRQLQF